MAGNLNIKNANGKTVTLQNPDTNNTNIVVDVSKIVQKVTSTDNAIVRFDGTDGAVKNSTIIADNNGSLQLTSPTGGLGYGTGAGGTVTQLTSKSTAVTLDKPSGTIITHNAALAAGASVSFTITNTLVTQLDTVRVNATSAVGDNYRVETSNVNTNSFTIRLTNITGGSLSQVISLSFAIIKGANA